jgi:DNA primase
MVHGLFKLYREKWVSCMKRAVYSHRTRTDLIIGLPNTYPDLDQLETAEQAAVKEDRRCISNSEEQDFQNLAAKYCNYESLSY